MLLFLTARHGGASPHPEKNMKYGIAWLIGIPPVIIGAWFLLNHC